MNWQPKHTSLVVIAVGFALFYFIFKKEWMLVPIGMSFVGFLIAPMGEFLHLSWMMLAKVLGYINSRILLSVIFFVFLTPIAVLMRLLGKSSFLLSQTHKTSFFVIRNHVYSKADLEQPF
jgi:hypothetical protein